VARLEAILTLLAFVSDMSIKLFSMDVKCASLNGFLNENVYVEQPPSFENPEFPYYIFRLRKVLYGLKQTPRAWYKHLSKFLLETHIIFGSTNNVLH